MMSFLDDLAAVKQAGKPKSQRVSVLVNGNVHELVFCRADGDAWADCVARNPARPDSKVDLRFGYNFNAVVAEIVPLTGRVVDGDDEVELPAETWGEVLKTISGHEMGRVTDAVWALNEWDPAQEIEKAKKALSGGSKRKSA